MSKEDIFDGEYTYLAYPLQDNTHTNEMIFDLGMLLKGKTLGVCQRTIPVAYHEEKFQELLLECSNIKSTPERVVIVKIPSEYLGYNQIKGKRTPCMPLIRTYFDYFNGQKDYLIPQLVLGIYNPKTTEWKENPNYNVMYDPKGLQFANEQIDRVKWHIPGMEERALYRRNISQEVLYMQDELSGVFKSTIEYYYSLARNKPYTRNKTNLGFREMT